MEENVNQAKKIQSSRHQHCTSARRNSQLSAKKRLWLWRWLTPNDRWLLMPQPSISFCPSLGTCSTPNVRIEAPKVLKQLWTTAYRLYNVLRLAIHNRCASRQPRRKEGWEANCGLSLTKPTAVHVGVVKNVKMRQGHQQGWSFLVLRHF